jgi:nicotinate-nucleotide pyrophosphorylase (carboxylating)
MHFPEYLTQDIIDQNVASALSEDFGGQVTPERDLTAFLIDENSRATATVVTRESMVMCGKPWAQTAFYRLDSNLQQDWHVEDGEHVAANQTLVTLTGNARAILSAERTALNFLQTLSATATHTANCVKHLANSSTQLLDTRKTLPGLRAAQKYAVLCGGGNNHRVGVYDAFLIKENHVMACGGIKHAVAKAKQNAPGKPVEIEVENLTELTQALDAQADIVMLDNFTLELIREAVVLATGRCKLEVSGNVTEQHLQQLASVGVDYISSGALTKHVTAVDLSLRFQLDK